MRRYRDIKIEILADTCIKNAISDVLDLSEKTGKIVEFSFNGESMRVYRIGQYSLKKQLKFYTDIYYQRVSDKLKKTLIALGGGVNAQVN